MSDARCLYLHVPFCRGKCRYCDFPSAPEPIERRSGYAEAMAAEARGWREREGGFECIYVGGGTPTLLLPAEWELVFGAIGSAGECTVEANPETVTRELAASLRAQGATRISIGAQSFDDDVLSRVGRAARGRDIHQAFRAARDAGFEEVNLDLMFGLPGQTAKILREDLRKTVELEPEHVSFYGLTLAHGTPLARDVDEGKVSVPGEEEILGMFREGVELLERRFRRYEISNFAKPGHECGYNVRVWRGGEYYGAGAAACGYVDGERYENIRDVVRYRDTVMRGGCPVETRERPDGVQRKTEIMMLGLRTMWGVSDEAFSRVDGRGLEEDLPAIGRFVDVGLVERTAEGIRLTRRGIEVSDYVIVELARNLQ